MPMNPRLMRPLARFQAPAPPAQKVMTLVSTKDSGSIHLYISSNSESANVRVEWWDGTVESGFFCDGGVSKAVAGPGEKIIRVYPLDEEGNVSGDFQSVGASGQSLTSITFAGVNVVDMTLSNNLLTSLDVSDLTALTALTCDNNPLTSLDVSGLTALSTLRCSNTSITSLRATGCAFGGWYSTTWNYGGGTRVQNNLLNAAALDQFYTDLANGTGWINVSGNPGTGSDDPTIATAKGYTVYGS